MKFEIEMTQKLITLILVCIGLFKPHPSKCDPPSTPIFLAVSVLNSEGFVKLTWFQQDANSVSHYKIDRWVNNNEGLIIPSSAVFISNDTVSWTDMEGHANNQRLMYKIISFSDLESSQPSASIPTIFQREPNEQNDCERKISLYWTEYGIDVPIQQYRIRYMTDDGQDNDTVVSTNTLSTIDFESPIGNTSYSAPVYKYIIEGLNPSINYQFLIEAVDPNLENLLISSNVRENELNAIPQPQPPVINQVTVNDANKVDIYAIINPSNASKLIIQRDTIQEFTINPFLYELPVSHSIPLPDLQAKPDENSYYYAISLLDQCNQEIKCPLNHRTILLKGSSPDRNNVNLSWNHYEGWDVDTYKINRKQGESAWVPIATLSGSSTSFTDDLLLLPDNESALSYKVVAIGDNFESQSNIVNLQPDYTPYFPSAFNPLSDVTENTVFKPISDFYNTNGYQLLVYDRWGGLVWSTSNPSEGWNGRDAKGKLCQKGVYVYQLSYKDQNNLPYQLNGSVTLIYY